MSVPDESTAKAAAKIAKKQQRKLKRSENSHEQVETEVSNDMKDAQKKLKKLKKAEKAKRKAEATNEDDNDTIQEKRSSNVAQEENDAAVHKKSKKTKVVENDVETVSAYLKKHNITVDGIRDGAAPALALDFARTGLRSELLECTKTFSAPTPIQAVTWPLLLGGQDMVGIAETGSGKTLAFALPALDFILQKSKSAGAKSDGNPLVLVLAPTRELALQTQATFESASASLKDAFKVHSLCVYGGVPKYAQVNELRKKRPAVLVATPGRLMDLMDDGAVNLSNVGYFILDEADRMLDQGFEPDIRKIVSQLPAKAQRRTAMFSATWPDAIKKLAFENLCEPIARAAIGSTALATSQTVTHHVMVIDNPADKPQRLTSLLSKLHTGKNRILVFVLYKKEVPFLERVLSGKGYKVGSLAGDKAQRDREAALEGFKNGSKPILVATDVAARGLDISGVEYVINYTFPLTIEDYVHRCGRTGRGGHSGIAYTFFTHLDKNHSGELINVLKSAGAEVPANLLAFGTTVKKKEHKAYGSHFKEIDPTVKGTKILFD